MIQRVISNNYGIGTFAHILLPFIYCNCNVCLYGLQTLVR